MKKFLLCLAALVGFTGFSVAADPPFIQQQPAPASVIAVQRQSVLATPTRAVSMAIDQKAGIYKYEMSVDKGQTATSAAVALGELTGFIQSDMGADIESATVVKDPKGGYIVAVMVKKPEKATALAPLVPGLAGIEFVGNCPTNSHYQAKFAEGQFAKWTDAEKQQVKDAVVALAAFNHHLSAASKAKVNLKGEGLQAWTIEAVFPAEAFQQVSLIPFPQQFVPVRSGS